MKTEASWVKCFGGGRLYGKAQKGDNRTRLRLVELIPHRGEPSNGAPQTSRTHSEQVQIITPENRGGLTPKKLGTVDI